MSPSTFNGLMSTALAPEKKYVGESPMKREERITKRMNKLAVRNVKDLSFKELPEYLRLPTAEELDEMRVWAINYRRTTKSSKRQTRIATQEHFKIRIIQ